MADRGRSPIIEKPNLNFKLKAQAYNLLSPTPQPKVKVPRPMRSVGGVLISLSWAWARYRWINHWSLYRMASATPDLRLPPQPHVITARWPVPNYTALWQRHMCVNNYAQGCYLKAELPGVEPAISLKSRVQPLDRYATRPYISGRDNGRK